jgi:glucose-1-phosphate thymidylyltransferase
VKGIILAGGTGSRLYPLTLAVNKHLLPLAGVPMIFHPLSVLLGAGIRDVLVVTTPQDRSAFERLLGDGGQWGITIAYVEQPSPAGVPQAISLAQGWGAGAPLCVALGDNVFVGGMGPIVGRASGNHRGGARVFSCVVPDPRPYGVVVTAPDGAITVLEEKPDRVIAGARAVPGLYLYGPEVFTAIAGLSSSSGVGADVTDLNRWFWQHGALAVESLTDDIGWCDAGTHESLARATRMVEQEARSTGRPVACPDALAWSQGWIGEAQVRQRLAAMGSCPYADHVRSVLAAGRSAITAG